MTHLVVLLAFIFSSGGQWSAMQCVAWANMVREYSQMVPFTEAVSMTFSGQYPCELCKAIAEKKSSEQQKFLGLDKQQKKFLPPIAVIPFHPAETEFTYVRESRASSTRPVAPPTPPPRSTLS